MKRLSTPNLLTLKRPLPRMQPQVYLQTRLRSERLRALRAFVRLVGGVTLPTKVTDCVGAGVLREVA